MKRSLLTSLLAVVAVTGLQAQVVPEVPKLVVGLVVDQLRMDYVYHNLHKLFMDCKITLFQ